jgi:hypothetical protein
LKDGSTGALAYAYPNHKPPVDPAGLPEVGNRPKFRAAPALRAALEGRKLASYIMGMCGRTRLSTDYSETRIKLKFDPDYPAPNVPASWNVCPTDPMLVAIRSADGKRIPQQMRWGLVPWWAKDIKVGFSSINARAETVDTAPAFRDAWKKGQRCLVVTDGFYEWKKPEKQPSLLRWPTRATW